MSAIIALDLVHVYALHNVFVNMLGEIKFKHKNGLNVDDDLLWFFFNVEEHIIDGLCLLKVGISGKWWPLNYISKLTYIYLAALLNDIFHPMKLVNE